MGVFVFYCTFNIGIRSDAGENPLFQAILRNISRWQGDVVTILCRFGPTAKVTESIEPTGAASNSIEKSYVFS